LKLNSISIIIIILCVLFLISSVSANELNNTNLNTYSNNTQLANDNLNIYVDCDNGDDSNNGNSQTNPVKSFTKALELSQDNYTIYLSDGNYNGLKNTKIILNKSLTIIGSSNTVFDGQNTNYIFNITGNSKIIFKNIEFMNAFKKTSSFAPASMYGGALEINKAIVLIENCSFKDNRVACDANVNKYNYGGAISNFGDLTIINSYFNNNLVSSDSGLYACGGSIYNKGKLLINNTLFNNSTSSAYSYGGVIYNEGDLIINNSIIANAFMASESKGSIIYNSGNLTLSSSLIENNTISRSNFKFIYGAIYNNGNLKGYGNIFRNNSGIYESPLPEYFGSPTIFNGDGEINLTYNVFMNNLPFNGIASDVYINGGKITSLDNNWWSTNDNPYTQKKINVDNKINSWFILNLIPEYTPINIGENKEIIAYWSLSSTLTPNINLLPVLNITFTTDNVNITKPLINGKTTFNFNNSQIKKLYQINASIGEFNEYVMVDVGKIPSYMTVNVTSNVLYSENIILTVNVTSENENIPQGNVSVIIGKTRYTINLVNGKGQLNISKMEPAKYTFKIVYEGNDDYFKAFNYVNVTVNKAPTNLSIDFPDIYVDEKCNAIVTLGPKNAQGQAYLIINGERYKILYLYNGNNSISLKNFKEGEYNVTVEFVETNHFQSSNATTTFKVSKYDAQFNLSAENILQGQDAHITINVNPSDLQGEAILNINGVNKTIFIDKPVSEITVSNLAYGTYDIWVFFPENPKYHSFNASASFKVLRNLTSLDVEIIENELNGTVIVKTNNTGCSGSIGVYVNYRLYYSNLINGQAILNVTFDKGTNYIYVFYDGDKNHESANWNTTIGINEEFILIGEDSLSYEYNDFNYTVHLIENNGIPMPNRLVTVLFNNKNYTIKTNDEGIAYLPLNLNKGEYEITASYKNQTVVNKLIINEIIFNITVPNHFYGEKTRVFVEFENNITGCVNLFINGILNQTINITGKNVTYEFSGLNVGSYDILIRYFNDYFNSSQITSNFEVNKATPVFITDIHDVIYGENNTISLVILNNATGNVKFIVDGVNYTRTLINSSASLLLTNLEKYAHNVIIIYEGDSNFNNANLTKTFHVKSDYSNIILITDDSFYGENITVKAILNQTATGNITFDIQGLSQTVPIINGTAECTFKGILNTGEHNISAYYHGDSIFIDSKNSTSFKIFKNNSNIRIYVDEVCLGENILIYAILNDNATGSVSFSILNYYSPRSKIINDSVAVWYISPLDTGIYTILASYDGDSNYNASNTSYILNISQYKSILTVKIADATINDRIVAHVSLKSNKGDLINGNVVLKIEDKSYNVKVTDGVGSLTVGKLSSKKYTFSASYAGSDDYSRASYNGEFRVVDHLLNLTLSAKNMTCYYGADKNFTVHVKDDSGNPVSGIDLTVKINDNVYNLTSDNNGEVIIPINVGVGKYNVSVVSYQNSRYYSSNLTSSIEVLSTVEGIDVVSLFNTTTQYFAIFSDASGKALSNVEVTFIVAGKTYSSKTLPNGILRVNINLAPGKYDITVVNPVTGQNITNSIFIFQKLMENHDVIVYQGVKPVYKVRAYDNNGAPVGKGKTVVFKVNGKTYKVQTDKNGYASVKLNLKPNLYTITASFNGFKVSDKIFVKSLLSLEKISVKKSNVKFTAKLVNNKGKALKGKKITFKFKGKKYKVKTNKKGLAVLKINVKLSFGKYKILLKSGKLSLKKTFKIKK